MRITDVEADIVRIPLSTRFSGSVYQIESRCTIVTRVHTDEGLISEVYSGDERTGYQLLKDLVVGPMKDAVVGEDPTAIERCWQKMFALTPHISDKAIAMRAIAAIDVALWTLPARPWASQSGHCSVGTPSVLRWCGSPTTSRVAIPRTWCRICCISANAVSAASS